MGNTFTSSSTRSPNRSENQTDEFDHADAADFKLYVYEYSSLNFIGSNSRGCGMLAACSDTDTGAVRFDRRTRRRAAEAPRRERHHARSVLASGEGWPVHPRRRPS